MALLRIKDVTEQVGLSKASIYRLIKDGKFPQQVQAGPKAVRWRAKDIKKWERGLEKVVN